MLERSVPRVRKNLVFLLPDGWRGEVIDLSATGLKLRTMAVLDKDLELEGHLLLEDGRKIAVSGVVVWTTPPDFAGYQLAQVGLELRNVSEEYLSELASYFASQDG